MPNGKQPQKAVTAKLIILILLASLMVMSLPLHVRGAGKLVAAVVSSDQARYREAHKAMVRTLASRGFDQNSLDIVMQNPNPDPISWANSIRKLNAIGADIIVTYGAPVTLTAVRETVEAPILFVDVYAPVETGISRSMTTAGRNVTGISSKVPMSTLLSALSGIKPIKGIGVIYSSREIGSAVQLKEIRRIAAQQGFNVTEANLSSHAGLDAALNSLLSQVNCLYVSECSVGARGFERIIRAAQEKHVPVVSQMPDAAEKGALLALEVNASEQGQLAGEYAAKILAGKKPSQLPILTPRKIDLVLNMRTAKSLDLTIPFHVLGQVTKILK